MEYSPLNREKQKHLYLQIAAQILQRIESAEWKDGDMIPSERELGDIFKVSRITAKKAVEYLQEKGLLYREVGRGTFIAKPKMENIVAFKGFSEYIASKGGKPGATIIEQSVQEPGARLAEELQIREDDLIVYIERIRTADGQIMALQSSSIRQALCPGLEQMDLANKSLYSIFKEHYGIYPAWTEVKMRASLADEEEARLLKIEPGEALLIVKALSFTEKFEIIEKVVTKYIGSSMDLYIGRQRIE
ncbi:MAG: GntR family transcriptional regulator [Chloroflexi bacterium]|nr:GntR family transcriptional regulator [Chloroflexota bacterium]